MENMDTIVKRDSCLFPNLDKLKKQKVFLLILSRRYLYFLI